jgi:hypothetical protein
MSSQQLGVKVFANANAHNIRRRVRKIKTKGTFWGKKSKKKWGICQTFCLLGFPTIWVGVEERKEGRREDNNLFPSSQKSQRKEEGGGGTKVGQSIRRLTLLPAICGWVMPNLTPSPSKWPLGICSHHNPFSPSSSSPFCLPVPNMENLFLFPPSLEAYGIAAFLLQRNNQSLCWEMNTFQFSFTRAFCCSTKLRHPLAFHTSQLKLKISISCLTHLAINGEMISLTSEGMWI